jgi:hypothetical protein
VNQLAKYLSLKMVLLIKKIIFLQRIAPFKAYATVVDNSNEEPKIRA